MIHDALKLSVARSFLREGAAATQLNLLFGLRATLGIHEVILNRLGWTRVLFGHGENGPVYVLAVLDDFTLDILRDLIVQNDGVWPIELDAAIAERLLGAPTR